MLKSSACYFTMNALMLNRGTFHVVARPLVAKYKFMQLLKWFGYLLKNLNFLLSQKQPLKRVKDQSTTYNCIERIYFLNLFV